MRVLLDTDVVLDLLLDRAPFGDDAAAIWDLNAAGKLEAYISAVTPVNVYYIARKLKNAEIARNAVGELLAALRVCSLDLSVLQTALALPLVDYEDAVQHASAAASQLDAIITRNVNDYRNAALRIITPADLLRQLADS